jgi:hypothetical protein
MREVFRTLFSTCNRLSVVLLSVCFFGNEKHTVFEEGHKLTVWIFNLLCMRPRFKRRTKHRVCITSTSSLNLQGISKLLFLVQIERTGKMETY